MVARLVAISLVLAVRPVQVRNVGLPWDDPPDGFWSAL